MDRREFLKIFGATVASVPLIGVVDVPAAPAVIGVDLAAGDDQSLTNCTLYTRVDGRWKPVMDIIEVDYSYQPSSIFVTDISVINAQTIKPIKHE